MIYSVGVSFWCAFIAKDACLLHIHFFLNLTMGCDLGIFRSLCLGPGRKHGLFDCEFTGAPGLPKPLEPLQPCTHCSQSDPEWPGNAGACFDLLLVSSPPDTPLLPSAFSHTDADTITALWLLEDFPIHLYPEVLRATFSGLF